MGGADGGEPGLRYRRHRLYLRHGLEEGKSRDELVKKLQDLMTLADEGGEKLKFRLSLVNNATLLLESPVLQPSKRYSLEVRASEDVRDGFGQPLRACRTHRVV